MDAALVVLQKIGIMFLVMVAGALARRCGWLGPEVTRGLSRFVVDLAFPALVFTQMLRTVTVPALRAGWWIPLLAAGLILGSAAVGRLVARLLRTPPEERRTFVFLVAIPNWVFLPLPIAEGLYGAEGVRFVLLVNLGAQIVLWTEGVRLLNGRALGRETLRGLLGNAGLLATLGGILAVVAWPAAAQLGEPGMGAGLAKSVGGVLIGALRMMGDLTIPLSLLVIGAQLGRRTLASRMATRALGGVVAARLVVAPLALMAALRLINWLGGWHMPETAFVTTGLIVSMPVAISGTLFVDRFGGDIELSAAAIFYTTLISLVTVPVIVLVCRSLCV